jgi:hypothetical protein
MKRTILSLLLVLALLAIGSVPTDAKGNGVDDLRGKWVFNWTFVDGTKQPPLELYVNDIGPGSGESAYLASGCMRTLASRAMMPLSLSAVYHPVENTYDLVVYSTVVPPQESGQPPYVIRFDGLAQINGSGVADDSAVGTYLSNPGQGTWDGHHHDRRRVKCPPVDMGGQRLDTDVYAQHDLAQPESENISMTLEGRSIQIVSSAMRVTTPDGQVFNVPFYTDMFSPGVNFINEFRFIGGYPGAPISGKPYQFILLDALGQPIPGTESQDSWTKCYDAAPGQALALPNPAAAQDVTVSWTGIPTVPGEFEPGTIGFYQMGLWPQGGQAGEFGANWMGSTTHVIPWTPFSPGAMGSLDGYDHGVSLSEFGDGLFRFNLGAFYQPNPASGSYGLECAVYDSREDLLMTKTGEAVEFFKP